MPKPKNLERLARRKKKQTKLSFNRASPNSSSPALVSPAMMRRGGRALNSSFTAHIEDENQRAFNDESSDDILSSATKNFTQRGLRIKKNGGLPLPTPVKTSQRRVSGDFDSESSAGEPAEEEVDTPSKKASVSKTQHMALYENEDEISLPPPKVIRSRKPLFNTNTASSQKNRITISDSSDDDQVIASSARRRPSLKVTTVESSDDSEDEEPPTSPLKRRRQPVIQADSETDVASSPTKRRRLARKDCDHEDAPAPSSSFRATRQSQTKRRHRSEKEKKLELLRRKRAGEDIDEITETESDSEQEQVGGIYDSDASDFKALSEFDDEEEGEEAETEVKAKPRKSASKSKFIVGNGADEREPDEDDYDSGFVVSDEDGPIGVPGATLLDIPHEFTNNAHKPLKEHFRDAVEWCVHRKLNPGFARDDPVYRQAFVKLDSEYSGLAKSKFVSSQWTVEFTRVINARPVFVQRHPLEDGEGITIEGIPKCDVCNHRKHVPTYAISLSGKPYNKNTLDELDNGSDDSDTSDGSGDSDRLDYDVNGNSLPDQSKEWFAGVTCFNNALHAHALIHWRYALNDWVIDNLAPELTPNKLALRENMNTKKRTKYANALIDRWAADGTIKDLYRDFKIQLETARNVNTAGRWGR